MTDNNLDPRPDLRADHRLWSLILINAKSQPDGPDPNGLYGALHGLRCCGARLIKANQRTRLISGELGAEYPELRDKWLIPHAERLNDLLDWLGTV